MISFCKNFLMIAMKTIFFYKSIPNSFFTTERFRKLDLIFNFLLFRRTKVYKPNCTSNKLNLLQVTATRKLLPYLVSRPDVSHWNCNHLECLQVYIHHLIFCMWCVEFRNFHHLSKIKNKRKIRWIDESIM